MSLESLKLGFGSVEIQDAARPPAHNRLDLVKAPAPTVRPPCIGVQQVEALSTVKLLGGRLVWVMGLSTKIVMPKLPIPRHFNKEVERHEFFVSFLR